MAVTFQCMTKSTTKNNNIKKKIKNSQQSEYNSNIPNMVYMSHPQLASYSMVKW